MLTVAFVAFLLFQYVGDPVTQMLGQDATPRGPRAASRGPRARPALLRPVRPLRRQGGRRGISASACARAGRFVADRGAAARHARAVVRRGAHRAGRRHPDGRVHRVRRGAPGSPSSCSPSRSVGISLPTFLIGILLILVFAVQLGWLPVVRPRRGRAARLVADGLLTGAGWKHLILPSIALALFQLTLIMRLVRAEMLEVLRTDYIKFARARGLTDRAVHFGHALKNTLVPVITITGLQLGGIIAFALVTETVFQWPGHGPALHPVRAVRRHAGHGGLPLPDRARVRRHQPRRRPALLRGRPAPARSTARRRRTDGNLPRRCVARRRWPRSCRITKA